MRGWGETKPPGSASVAGEEGVTADAIGAGDGTAPGARSCNRVQLRIPVSTPDEAPG
jgi:hypothetical protein